MGFGFNLKQNTARRRELILNGPIFSTLLLLSLPTLMLGFVQSFMPMIDGMFVNNMIGKEVTNAISFSGPIINMFIAIAQGLSVAGMALIGQMNGKGQYKEAREVSTQVVVFTYILGCILAPLLIIVAFPVSSIVNDGISHYVFIYLSMFAMMLPLTYLEQTYNAIKNASGKPEAVFVTMTVMLSLKLIFNAIFIALFHWGIYGAILASLLSHLIISIWMFYDLFYRGGEERLILKGFKFNFTILKKLLKIGVPSILASLILSLGFLLINIEVEKYDNIVFNAQSIASYISSICFILPSAFGSAVTTMVSMNIGAGRGDKARLSCIAGCIVSVITAVVLIAIVVPLAPYLTKLFSDEQAVLDIANNSLNIYTYSVVGFGLVMVQQGAFIGLGRTKVPLVMGFLRIWLFRYVFILVTEQQLQYNAVFWGNLFSNYLAAIIITILMFRVKWVSFIPEEETTKKELVPA